MKMLSSTPEVKLKQDCYFYYYSSCTKGAACPYRHEPAALRNETMCIYWLQGNCNKPNCIFRHMEVAKPRDKIACFFESQPGGCKKPHCSFFHDNILDQPREEDIIKKPDLILPVKSDDFIENDEIKRRIEEVISAVKMDTQNRLQSPPPVDSSRSVSLPTSLLMPRRTFIVSLQDGESDSESTSSPIKHNIMIERPIYDHNQCDLEKLREIQAEEGKHLGYSFEDDEDSNSNHITYEHSSSEEEMVEYVEYSDCPEVEEDYEPMSIVISNQTDSGRKRSLTPEEVDLRSVLSNVKKPKMSLTDGIQIQNSSSEKASKSVFKRTKPVEEYCLPKGKLESTSQRVKWLPVQNRSRGIDRGEAEIKNKSDHSISGEPNLFIKTLLDIKKEKRILDFKNRGEKMGSVENAVKKFVSKSMATDAMKEKFVSMHNYKKEKVTDRIAFPADSFSISSSLDGAKTHRHQSGLSDLTSVTVKTLEEIRAGKQQRSLETVSTKSRPQIDKKVKPKRSISPIVFDLGLCRIGAANSKLKNSADKPNCEVQNIVDNKKLPPIKKPNVVEVVKSDIKMCHKSSDLPVKTNKSAEAELKNGKDSCGKSADKIIEEKLTTNEELNRQDSFIDEDLLLGDDLDANDDEDLNEDDFLL